MDLPKNGSNRSLPKTKSRLSVNAKKEKKDDSLSSSDPNLSYEDYLAKQQRKFKKLFGKKLIVEDDY